MQLRVPQLRFLVLLFLKGISALTEMPLLSKRDISYRQGTATPHENLLQRLKILMYMNEKDYSFASESVLRVQDSQNDQSEGTSAHSKRPCGQSAFFLSQVEGLALDSE